MVNQEQIEGADVLDARGERPVFIDVMGHLKAGVTQSARRLPI